MSNPWFRMYAEFQSDPKVQMMSEQYQRRLVMLFCMKCNGDETFHDDEIVFQLRIGQVEWAETKAEFIKRGFIDSGNNLLNWGKRQYQSDSSTSRVKKHRETRMKRPCNVSVTPPEQNRTDTEAEKKVSSRGTRFALQDPPEDWITFCQANRPELEVRKTFDGFRDYWIAKPGKDGVKVDWGATWRNWVRNQNSVKGNVNATNSRDNSDGKSKWATAAEQYISKHQPQPGG